MSKNNFLLYLLFSFISIGFQAQNYNALFIGNSYTGVNNLPSLTSQLTTSLGDTLTYSSNTPGGYTLQGHSTNTTTLNSIEQGNWDFVILQDQSQRPSFSPAQVATEVYPYAKTLVDSIKSANTCTEPLFYMTWGRENGDQQNCQFYSPICTYNGMQERLRTSYMEMATDNNASVSPVGAAWKYTRDNYPTINLYSPDESHPSLEGSYLAACVFYSSMFKKSPEGASFNAGLSTATASTLQEVAKLIVIDSLETWRIGTNDVSVENITSTVAGTTYQFSATNNNAINFNWNFGNGTSSTDENPTVTYNANGIYTITLNADNGCNSDITSTTITVSLANVSENELTFDLKQDNSLVLLEFLNSKNRNITIYDLNGKILQSKISYDSNITLNTEKFPPIFLIVLNEGDKMHTIKILK